MEKLEKKPTIKDEIDVLGFIQQLWFKRMVVLKWVLVFAVLGVVFALLSVRSFTASSSFITQTSQSDGVGGNLGGLASLAGISLGGSSEANIAPPLYPKILQSIDFKRKLIEKSIASGVSNSNMTYSEYFENVYSPGLLGVIKTYTIGLPGKLKSLLTKSGEKSLTTKENYMGIPEFSTLEIGHFQRVSHQLSVQLDKNTGLVTISFEMPTARLSAQMVRHAESLLQQELIRFKVQKAKGQLDYTKRLYDLKKKEYNEIEDELVAFEDANQGLSTSKSRSRLQRIQSERDLSYDVYSQLAKQLEEAKLGLNRDTPIFSIIQPVVVPSRPSGLSRTIIFILTIICGISILLVYLFIRFTIKGMGSTINN